MELLTETETAARLKISRVYLNKARQRGQGPAFTKIGRAVRYPVEAVDAFIKANTRGGL